MLLLSWFYKSRKSFEGTQNSDFITGTGVLSKNTFSWDKITETHAIEWLTALMKIYAFPENTIVKYYRLLKSRVFCLQKCDDTIMCLQLYTYNI